MITLTKKEENADYLLNRWSKVTISFWCIFMGLYFSFGSVLILQGFLSGYVFIIALGTGVFLALIRNRLLMMYNEDLRIKNFQKILPTSLIGIVFLLVTSYILPYLGGSGASGLIPSLIGIMLIIVPLNPFLDFHTDLGETVFYFGQAISDNRNNICLERGTSKLENHLKSLGISVSSEDLYFKLNIAKIQGKDINSILERLINSLKTGEKDLHSVLVEILGEANLIKKIDKASWKDFSTLLTSKSDLLKLILSIVFGILVITYFLLTGRTL